MTDPIMSPSSMAQDACILAVEVPSRLAKTVKSDLEREKIFNKKHGIRKLQDGLVLIPTNITYGSSDLGCANVPYSLKDYQCRRVLVNKKELEHHNRPSSLSLAVVAAREKLKLESDEFDGLLALSNAPYYIFSPMLLLSSRIEKTTELQLVLEKLAEMRQLSLFWSDIATSMHVTHIAINAPIPAISEKSTQASAQANIHRSPSGFEAVYGDFGAQLPPPNEYHPTKLELEQAFWVQTTQNGIHQTWAPRYTMFSNGNVTEKARLLHLESVKSAVAEGRESGRGCAAVDLYAGIGYFAFSYIKAGINVCLCWDINPWSSEALCRGAALNKWHARDITVSKYETSSNDEAKALNDMCKSDAQFLIFTETNARAISRIAKMRGVIPPIRHVNCGMLPTAVKSWKTALQIIDAELGGWIHLHESVYKQELDNRVEAIMVELNHFFATINTNSAQAEVEALQLEHVQTVKSMGPRLVHIVLDIFVPAH